MAVQDGRKYHCGSRISLSWTMRSERKLKVLRGNELAILNKCGSSPTSCRLSPVHCDRNAQTVKILRILYGFQKASTPLNAMKAFRRTGVVSRWHPTAETLICYIDQACAREVRHWNQAKLRVSVILGLGLEGKDPKVVFEDRFE
jgi:hypothetical protein